MQIVASCMYKTIIFLFIAFRISTKKLSGNVGTPIPYVTFHFRDRHDAASSVTEIAPPQAFLCVNRTPVR